MYVLLAGVVTALGSGTGKVLHGMAEERFKAIEEC